VAGLALREDLLALCRIAISDSHRDRHADGSNERRRGGESMLQNSLPFLTPQLEYCRGQEHICDACRSRMAALSCGNYDGIVPPDARPSVAGDATARAS
jgi:hypothetical protein